MKNIFYTIALLVTCAAVYFSWLNQKKFETEKQLFLVTKHGITNGMVAGTNQPVEPCVLKAVNSTDGKFDGNDQVTAQISKTEKQLKDERLGLDVARKLLEERSQALEAAKMKKSTLDLEFSKTEATLEEQGKKLADLEKIRKQIEETLGQIGGIALEQLPEKVDQVRKDKAALDKRLEELTTLVEAGRANVKKNQTEIARLADRKAVRDIKIVNNAMEATITGVNHEWGFVLINAGSKTGFTPQTELIDKRDGRMIGKLRPSSIEPNQTVAEIEMDSLSPGVRLRPGDLVILGKPST